MTRPPPPPSLQTSPARLRGAGGGWLGDTPLLVLSAVAPTTTTATFFITRTYFRSTILPILSSPFSPRYGNGHAPPGLHRRRRPRLPESPSWAFQIFSFRFGFSLVVLKFVGSVYLLAFSFLLKGSIFFFWLQRSMGGWWWSDRGRDGLGARKLADEWIAGLEVSFPKPWRLVSNFVCLWFLHGFALLNLLSFNVLFIFLIYDLSYDL